MVFETTALTPRHSKESNFFIMKNSIFTRIIGMAFCLAMLCGPQIAFAADATPTQVNAVTDGAKTYLKALVTGDSDELSAITTSGFTIVQANGKPVAPSQIAARTAETRLSAGEFIGNVATNDVSATDAGLVSTATLSVEGMILDGNEEHGIGATSKHRLSWVLVDGQWRVSRDVIVSDSRSN